MAKAVWTDFGSSYPLDTTYTSRWTLTRQGLAYPVSSCDQGTENYQRLGSSITFKSIFLQVSFQKLPQVSPPIEDAAIPYPGGPINVRCLLVQISAPTDFTFATETTLFPVIASGLTPTTSITGPFVALQLRQSVGSLLLYDQTVTLDPSGTANTLSFHLDLETLPPSVFQTTSRASLATNRLHFLFASSQSCFGQFQIAGSSTLFFSDTP